MNRFVAPVLSCVAIIIMYLLFHSPSFERIPPNVSLYVMSDKNKVYPLNTSFFNPINDIYLRAFDSSGLASYSVRITDKEGKELLKHDEVLLKKTEILDVALPKINSLKDGDEIFYHISVHDWSNANIFRGNEVNIIKHLTIKTEVPQVQVIAASEQIVYGGSALVAFSIQNRATKEQAQHADIDAIIVSNGHDDFEAYPFLNKQNKLIYLALIAWPIKNTFFDGTIRVVDAATNEKKIHIPIAANVTHVRRKFNVDISDLRLQTMIKKLEENIVMPQDFTSNIEKFQFFNETLRYQDNQRIGYFFQIAKQIHTEKSMPRFNVFAPLHDAYTSGRFGDEYVYKYHRESVGSSMRYGIDFISEQGANVINSNDGIIAYKGKIGGYGNLVVINHKLGLSALYGYLGDMRATAFGNTESLSVIGEAGNSGLAATNGFFFATLVQGHFVNPSEWLQPQWVEKNINQVLERADNFGVKYAKNPIKAEK